MQTRQAKALPVLLLLGICALALGQVVPLVSPLLIALVLGAAATNLPLRDGSVLRSHEPATRLVLRLGVVLIGLRLPLQELAEIGPRGIVVILLAIVVTFAFTCLLGDRLGLDRGLVTMIAAGFSVCGAAAIAAVEGGIRRRREDVALAIVLVTIFGSLMIVALPLTAGLLDMSDAQTGVWAGAAIHEVAQVVAAASTAGTVGIALAMTVKLGRVALLAPVYVVARRRDGGPSSAEGGTPLVPWFVIGFLVSAAVRSTGLMPETLLEVADQATTVLLAAAMFGLGLGMVVRDLFPVPMRAVGLAAASTLVAATVSLTATLLLF